MQNWKCSSVFYVSKCASLICSRHIRWRLDFSFESFHGNFELNEKEKILMFYFVTSSDGTKYFWYVEYTHLIYRTWVFTPLQQSQKVLEGCTLMYLSDLMSECLAVVVFLFFFLDSWSQIAQHRQASRHHVCVCVHMCSFVSQRNQAKVN